MKSRNPHITILSDLLKKLSRIASINSSLKNLYSNRYLNIFVVGSSIEHLLIAIFRIAEEQILFMLIFNNYCINFSFASDYLILSM